MYNCSLLVSEGLEVFEYRALNFGTGRFCLFHLLEFVQEAQLKQSFYDRRNLGPSQAEYESSLLTA